MLSIVHIHPCGTLLLRFSFNNRDIEKAMHSSVALSYNAFNIFKIHIHVSFETLLSFTLLDCMACRFGDRCLLERKQKAISLMSRKQEATENKLAHWYMKALSKSFSRAGLVGNQQSSWEAQRAASNYLQILMWGRLIYSMAKSVRRCQLFFFLYFFLPCYKGSWFWFGLVLVWVVGFFNY